jgi:undecaprenyl-diphosphatase
MDINRAIVVWFQEAFDGHVIVDALAVFLAEYLPYFLVVGLFYYSFRQNSWRNRVLFFLLLGFVLLISVGFIAWPLQVLVGSDRPFQVLGFDAYVFASTAHSFPSLHATFFAAISTLLLLIDRKWGLWYGLATVFVGVGRVAAGVHWPVDVLAGFFIGTIGALIGSYLASSAFYSLRNPSSKD